MKNIPKVTIITITYNIIKENREELFEECLRSIHNQTYSNIEHIIIDGASNDGTLELIKKYADKGWVNFYSEPDNGVDDAYNKGIKKATGKYIAFMNSDDSYYDQNAVKKSIDALESAKADYSYANEIKVKRDGSFDHMFIPKPENFWKNMPFSHQTMFVKKDVLLNLGGYNTEYKIGGDYFLVLQLILNDYKGIYINETISRYTLGGFSGDWENKKNLYTCTSILAKRMTWFFKKFYKDIDEDIAQHIYWHGDYPHVYPKLFLQKLLRFMIEKDLKNFDYNKFANYLNSIIYSTPSKQTYTTSSIYLFYFIPLLKIKQSATRIYYRLFHFIPILKIKKT